MVAVEAFYEGAVLDYNEKALVLQAVDTFQIAYCSVMFKSTAFSQYKCTSPKSIGIPLSDLVTTLSCADNHNSCSIRTIDEKSQLRLIYDSKCKQIYSFSLSNLTSDISTLPQIERYSATLTRTS